MNQQRLLALVVCVLFSAACTSGSATTTSSDSATTDPGVTETTIDDISRFRVGIVSAITTDNWWAAMESSNTPYNQAFLGNGKLSMFTLSKPGFVYVPGLAATPEPVTAIEEDDVWVVSQPIRDDVSWSDGTPVTAEDLVFYFDTVREFDLRGEHETYFSTSVLDVNASDEHTVRIEFATEPALATWHTGVALAPFVPAGFWRQHVESARVAAREEADALSDQALVDGLVNELNADDDDSNDATAGEITAEQTEEYRLAVEAGIARAILYAVEAPMEPSAGPQIYQGWEPGLTATTVSNPSYHGKGSEMTLYSDGSFRIANDDRGENGVYGGDASGEVLARYVEGPHVEEIVWVETGARDEAYEMLAAGEVDYVFDPNGVTDEIRRQLEEFSGLEFSVSQREGHRYLGFNLRKAPMSDLAFRQAVATVIDKETIAETVLDGSVFPAYTMIHPGLSQFYNEDVDRAGWSDGAPLDEAERYETAASILREAGYTWEVAPQLGPGGSGAEVVAGEGLIMPDGTNVPELTILAPGMGDDPLRARFGREVERAMEKLGIPIRTSPRDFDSIIEAVFPPQTPQSARLWDMYILGWGAADPALPGASLVRFFHSREDAVTGSGFNTTGYRSEEFDAAADALDVATDMATAAQLTKEMEAILARDLPYVVLFRVPIVEAHRASVSFPVGSIMGGHAGYPNAWVGAVQVAD